MQLSVSDSGVRQSRNYDWFIYSIYATVRLCGNKDVDGQGYLEKNFCNSDHFLAVPPPLVLLRRLPLWLGKNLLCSFQHYF